MGLSRQESWSGLPCPPPRDLPNPGIELGSPALLADSLPSDPGDQAQPAPWEPFMGSCAWDPTPPHPLHFLLFLLSKKNPGELVIYCLSPSVTPRWSLCFTGIQTSSILYCQNNFWKKRYIRTYLVFFNFFYSFEIYSLANTLKEIYSSPKWKFLAWGKRIVSQNCGCWLLVEASGNN